MKKVFLTILAIFALASAAMAADLTWNASVDALPSGNAQMHGTALVTVGANTFLYQIGGNTAAAADDSKLIYYTKVTGTTADTWSSTTYQFPVNNAVYITRSSVGYNGYLYVVGGRFNSTGATYNGVRVFQPTATGDITAALQEYDGSSYTPLLDRLEMAVAVKDSNTAPSTQGVLYIIGGGSTNPRETAVQKVYIDKSTGQVTGTVTSAGTLATGVGSCQAVIRNGYLYVVAGYPGSTAGLTTTQYAQIQGDDNLGTFTNCTAALPEGRFDGGSVLYNDTIYMIGGAVSGNADTRNTVYRATFTGNDITAWTADTAVPVTPGIRRVGAVASNSAIFVIAGRLDAAAFTDKLHIAFDPAQVDDWMNY